MKEEVELCLQPHVIHLVVGLFLEAVTSYLYLFHFQVGERGGRVVLQSRVVYLVFVVLDGSFFFLFLSLFFFMKE